MLYMEPVIAPFVSEVALRLCDLIGVMWENIIHTATMDIHVLAKMFDTDAGALNIPDNRRPMGYPISMPGLQIWIW